VILAARALLEALSAIEWADRALALEHELKEHVARVYTNLTSSAATSRNYELAWRYVAEGLEYCQEHDLDSWVMFLLSWRARLKFELCDWDGAGEDAQNVLQSSSTTVDARVPALIVLGQLRTRRSDPQASVVLDEAGTLVESTLELQRIAPLTLASAEAAWLAGDPAATVAVLARYGGEAEQRRALELFETLGSTQFAQALRRQMRICGVRRIPRGSRRSTRDHSLGLTRREAQIFDLISEGLRNSEIAARLFLSTRTVDHHVSAVLTKLGVPSRAAAIARARGPARLS
jgi:DNA-binding CsgD family transcriptional regulator